MSISPWLLLLCALPVLLVGEWLVRRVRWLYRFNIPEPVVGGLLISGLLLTINVVRQQAWGLPIIRWEMKVDAAWWTWLGMVETQWWSNPRQDVDFTLMVVFFTCIGLNASWAVAKRGGVQLVWFLGISAVLAVAQNATGHALAVAMGQTPHLGIMCGSVALTGGPATVMGFVEVFEKAGYSQAAIVGTSAAVFGLVCGSLLGGPLGGRLVRRYNLHAPRDAEHAIGIVAESAEQHGILAQSRVLWRRKMETLRHLLLIALAIKSGAWLSLALLAGLQMMNPQFSFPPYMGALIVGILLRNLLDATGRRIINPDTIELIASVSLGIFLTVRMMSLNLILLKEVAGPMLVILIAQVITTLLFAYFITYRLMGRNYDAAVMSSGQVGFALGATSNAVANMETLTNRHGPSPRAFLVVTTVGAFLIDIVNMLLITWHLNQLR